MCNPYKVFRVYTSAQERTATKLIMLASNGVTSLTEAYQLAEQADVVYEFYESYDILFG